MSVEYRTGSLFQQGLTALGNGVNCQGLMDGGFAEHFRDRWPDMYTAYRKECEGDWLRPGGLHVWTDRTGTTIYNLAIQDQPGRTATLLAIHQSLRSAVTHACLNGIHTIGLPRLSSATSGLYTKDIAAIVQLVAGPAPVRIMICTGEPGRP